MPQIVDTKYVIKQDDANIALGSDTTAGSGDGSTEKLLARYTVPNGVRLMFLPQSEFQLYSTDNESTPAELNDYVAWRVIHKDNTGQGTFQRASGLYLNSKFNADVNSRFKLDNKFLSNPNELVEIWVTPQSSKSLKSSTAKFTLSCRRIAPQLVP